MSAGLASAEKNAMPQAVCVGTWGKACKAADEADTVCVFDGFTSCWTVAYVLNKVLRAQLACTDMASCSTDGMLPS